MKLNTCRILALAFAVTLAASVLPTSGFAGEIVLPGPADQEFLPLHSTAASAATSDYVDQTINKFLDDERVGRLVLEQGKAAVFLFEGSGKTSKVTVRQNALCVVVKNIGSKPAIVFEDNFCSTVPDYPKDTDFNDGRDMPIVRDGLYHLVTVNHKGYPALEVTSQAEDGSVPVIRFNEDDASSGRVSTCRSIHIHHRVVNGLGEGYANSAGCFLIGPIAKKYDAYVRFLRAVGVIGAEGNLDTPLEETGVPMGVVIVDRKCALRYLDMLYGKKGRVKILNGK